jgi:hypothetical protein
MELIMHYVCIENNKVINILGYQPEVPSSVSLVTITDEQYRQISAQTHVFDVTSKQVVPMESALLAQKAVDLTNAQEREFLNSSDWQVLRHIRQKTLGIATSLTEDQYLALERQREDAASRIV